MVVRKRIGGVLELSRKALFGVVIWLFVPALFTFLKLGTFCTPNVATCYLWPALCGQDRALWVGLISKTFRDFYCVKHVNFGWWVGGRI